MSQELKIYPCEECGVMRTKAEGGTTFTVCDECWEKHFTQQIKEISRTPKEEDLL